MLPAQSIRHLVICLGGIIAFIMLAIYPSQKSLTRLDKEIKKTQNEIEDQKILFPIAKEMLRQIMEKESYALPFPEKKKLESEKMAELPAMLEDMAGRCDLGIISIIPDVKSLSENAGYLSVTAIVKGRFADIRRFLIQMGGLPYLERFEEMTIEPAEGSRRCLIKAWVAVSE
jgi:hypothetical protein